MVKIRLSRCGTKRRPFYKIVVADNRFSRDGRFIEHLGYFNPIPAKTCETLKFNLNRITFWKEKGAQVSERVKKLIKISNKKEAIS